MTKIEIVEKVTERVGFTKKETVELVETVFEIMKGTLENGETLKISGFGNFVVKSKKDRTGRNPQTGEAMTITARKILTFKPSNLLKTAINNQAV